MLKQNLFRDLLIVALIIGVIFSVGIGNNTYAQNTTHVPEASTRNNTAVSQQAIVKVGKDVLIGREPKENVDTFGNHLETEIWDVCEDTKFITRETNNLSKDFSPCAPDEPNEL